jgi:BON domain-containing protein
MTESATKVEDVQPRAQTALRASPIFALRDLRVEQTGDALLISGLVSSFYHKQLAQEVVRAVAEGVEVINSIHVL